jgi:hypothetical protein
MTHVTRVMPLEAAAEAARVLAREHFRGKLGLQEA